MQLKRMDVHTIIPIAFPNPVWYTPFRSNYSLQAVWYNETKMRGVCISWNHKYTGRPFMSGLSGISCQTERQRLVHASPARESKQHLGTPHPYG